MGFVIGCLLDDYSQITVHLHLRSHLADLQVKKYLTQGEEIPRKRSRKNCFSFIRLCAKIF